MYHCFLINVISIYFDQGKTEVDEKNHDWTWFIIAKDIDIHPIIGWNWKYQSKDNQSHGTPLIYNINLDWQQTLSFSQ